MNQRATKAQASLRSLIRAFAAGTIQNMEVDRGWEQMFDKSSPTGYLRMHL